MYSKEVYPPPCIRHFRHGYKVMRTAQLLKHKILCFTVYSWYKFAVGFRTREW